MQFIKHLSTSSKYSALVKYFPRKQTALVKYNPPCENEKKYVERNKENFWTFSHLVEINSNDEMLSSLLKSSEIRREIKKITPIFSRCGEKLIFPFLYLIFFFNLEVLLSFSHFVEVKWFGEIFSSFWKYKQKYKDMKKITSVFFHFVDIKEIGEIFSTSWKWNQIYKRLKKSCLFFI